MKRKINLITIAVCCTVILLLTTAFFIMPDKDISEKENRSLSQIPAFNPERLFSGKFTSDLASYISDQFPLRDTFISVKAYSELLLGKGENNGVIYAKNDTLIAKSQTEQNVLDENLATIKSFGDAIDIPVYVAAIPRSVDVFSEYLPETYPRQNDLSLWKNYWDNVKKYQLNYINIYDKLCEGNDYYRTDHHYNVYGAYCTYELLGKELDYKPHSNDFFRFEVASENFCGTAMRTSGFYLTKKDTITLLRYDTDTDYRITADGKSINLYDMSKLDTADKYAVFLGGNHARVDIVKQGTTRPRLLVIRDSFADSLAPFLALHFDLVMIDLRYYTDSVQKIVRDENIHKVLVIESIDELATVKNISYLRRPANE